MKEKILETAAEMFLNLGFKSVTMDDIAQELGISKKTVYTHYQNKTTLVEASCFHLFEVISAGIQKICNKQLNSIQELFEIKLFVSKNLNDEKSSPQFQLQKFFPDIHQKMRKKNFEVMKNSVFQNLERGMKEGLYRTDIHTEFITRIYFAGLFSIKDEDIIPSMLYNKSTAMNLFLDYHVRAIATPKGIEVLEHIKKEKIVQK